MVRHGKEGWDHSKTAKKITINSAVFEDYQKLFNLDDFSQGIAGVVYCWESFQSLLWLTQASTETIKAPLYIITHNTQGVLDTDSTFMLEEAPIAGFAQVISQEYPEIGCVHIDLDFQTDVALQAQQIIQAIQANDEETQVVYRDTKRFLPRVKRYTLETSKPFTVDPDGTYLITGGLGGLGLEAARWLVR